VNLYRNGLGRLWLLPLLLVLYSSSARAEAILNYEVVLLGTADGSLIVSESIDYDFGTLNRHGIYRDIPITVPAAWGGHRELPFRNIQIMQDGQQAQWQQSSVSGDAGPMLRLRIGDANSSITGQHTYQISYKVEDALLPSGDRDAFRWNAIGTGWNVPIEIASIWLTLPDELKGHPGLEHGFYTGVWGAVLKNGKEEWSPDAGTLRVTTLRGLAAHEGLTVEVSFPAGAIAVTSQPTAGNMMGDVLAHLWGWPVMLLGLGLAYWYWSRVGRDPEIGPVAVRYRPPQNLDAAEAGLLLDQSLDDADLAGSVIELARDGFLNIDHPEVDGLLDKLTGHDRPTLICLKPEKDWSELPAFKRHLMKSLFCYGDRFQPGGTESQSIVNTRNIWLNKAKSRILERAVEHRLFTANPKKVRTTSLAWAIGLPLPLLLAALWFSPITLGLKIGMATSFIPLSIFVAIIARALFQTRGKKLVQVLTLVTALIVMPFFMWSGQGIPDITFPGWSALLMDSLIPVLLLQSGLMLFAWQMPRRTLIGARVLRELLGFREFMRRAEAPRLRALLKEDPNYFEQTLPYAALFGLVDEWASCFEGLANMPEWYSGNRLNHLGRDISSLSSTGMSSSPPPSKSGGFSGGGGSSGGGGGGGGGGSW